MSRRTLRNTEDGGRPRNSLKSLNFVTSIHLSRRAMTLAFFLLLVLLSIGVLGSQTAPLELDFDRVQADSAFRDGVLFLHAGRVNDAVIAFQRTLSFKPDDVLARIWLGRAYYFGGYEEAAAEEWRQVSNLGGANPALVSFQDTLSARRGFSREIAQDTEFFPTASFRLTLPGASAQVLQGQETGTASDPASVGSFQMPGNIAIRPDGWFLAANFSQDSVQVYDANGRLRQNFTGGLGGFEGPFGLELLPDSMLAVSSLRGDRIYILDATSGAEIRKFGSSGIGPGQFLGPQYLAYDPAGYLYVSDYGNQRIHKWTIDGQFVFSFGSEELFARPTGILFHDGKLWVLDRGVLRSFDGSGNLMGQYSDSRLSNAESIDLDPEGRMLIFCRGAVYQFFPENPGLVSVYQSPQDEGRGVIDGIADRNGNLLLSDALRREIVVLSRLSGLYSGIHVQINKAVANDFPRVMLDVTVEDRSGRPILGIDGANFRLAESGRSLASTLVRRGYQMSDLSAQILLVPSSSLSQQEYRAAMTESLSSFWTLLPASDRVSVLNLGQVPQSISSNRGTLSEAEALVQALQPDPQWSLDLGIRLATNNLITQDAMRTIILLGDGSVGQESFRQFGLEEVQAYLRNNSVRLYYIHLGFASIDPVYEYLTENTGGKVIRFYELEDFSTILSGMHQDYPGRYWLEFESLFDPDFGRRYLPVEVEVNYLGRSGRDEAGYFAPLSF